MVAYASFTAQELLSTLGDVIFVGQPIATGSWQNFEALIN
jgi:hypothetical protein